MQEDSSPQHFDMVNDDPVLVKDGYAYIRIPYPFGTKVLKQKIKSPAGGGTADALGLKTPNKFHLEIIDTMLESGPNTQASAKAWHKKLLARRKMMRDYSSVELSTFLRPWSELKKWDIIIPTNKPAVYQLDKSRAIFLKTKKKFEFPKEIPNIEL